MEKQKCPELRFNGFFEVWNTTRLSDLGSIQTGSTPSTSDESYYSKNGLMWVTPTDINGQLVLNTDKKLSILGRKKARIVPPNTILVTCIASIGKNALLLEEGSFNQQINSLTPFERNDPYFLLTQSYFWSIGMQQFAAKGTMQIVNKTQFSNIETFVPSRLEQSSIGNFFQNFDQSIALHDKKLTQTQNLKKAMLEKMFPKEGSKSPEIRLKSFSEDWEERQLKDISFKVVEKNSERLHTETFTNSAQFGVISQRDFFDKDISNKSNIGGYYVVRDNDFIYNPRISNFAPVGPIKRNKLGRTGVVSPLYFVFRTHDVDHQFLETYFETSVWHKFMLLNGDTGARSDRLAIKDTIFMEMPIYCPSFEEQQKIGQFFKQLDEAIKLQQQQLQTVKNLKQALLAKMFV